MKIYRSKRDKKLYVLSINKSLSYLGECLEYMLYYDYPNGKWEKIPQYKQKDFKKEFEIWKFMTNLSTQVIRILTGYPPFKNPSWFNVGDKVRCINTTFTGREKINCIYTAIGKEINGGIIVKDKNGNIIDTIAECFALE